MAEVLFQRGGGLGISALTAPEEVDALLGLFEGVAAELSWQPAGELQASRDAAQHIAVIVDGEIAGGLQVVFGPGEALPCRRVWPEAELPGEAAHITMLALAKGHRGKPHLFGALCAELWRCCVAEGAGQIVLEATPPTLRLYHRLGWPLEVVGDLRPHWGEECFLCRMGVREVAGALERRAPHSATHRALVEQAYRDQDGVPLTGTAPP